MLKLKKDTQFIDPEEKIISESINIMFKHANEINNRSKRGKANYIVVSKEIANEINKLKWDVNTKKRYSFY